MGHFVPWDVLSWDCKFNNANIDVSTEELLKTVLSLKSKTSNDMNGISTVLIKNVFTVYSIKHILNLSFANGTVPHQIRIAKVIPIFKSKKKKKKKN